MSNEHPLRQEEYRAMAEEVRRARAAAADAESRAQVSSADRRLLDVLHALRVLSGPIIFGIAFGFAMGFALEIANDRWGGWSFFVGPSVEVARAAHNAAARATKPVPKQPRCGR